MDIDLPALAGLLSRPIKAVKVALPVSLGRKWPWPSKVRTNLATIDTDGGTLVLRFDLSSESLLDGVWDDVPWFKGHFPEGKLTIIEPGENPDSPSGLAMTHIFDAAEPMEMVDLGGLFPDRGRIYVPGATACQISFTQTIRDDRFRFDTSGIHIHSSEASTLLERGAGGALECCIY